MPDGKHRFDGTRWTSVPEASAHQQIWCSIRLDAAGLSVGSCIVFALVPATFFGDRRLPSYRRNFETYRLRCVPETLPADSTQNTAAVTSFTLYHRGCPVPRPNLSLPVRNQAAQLAVEFPAPVAMHGLRLHTAGGGAGPGPFHLEGSADGGATWHLVGASNPRLTQPGV
jgi:hypothetical protein